MKMNGYSYSYAEACSLWRRHCRRPRSRKRFGQIFVGVVQDVDDYCSANSLPFDAEYATRVIETELLGEDDP